MTLGEVFMHCCSALGPSGKDCVEGLIRERTARFPAAALLQCLVAMSPDTGARL